MIRESRREVTRLFQWLRGNGLTTIITGERGSGALTRHGCEEYVSDCVLLLDHRVTEQISKRRLRIVKYRFHPVARPGGNAPAFCDPVITRATSDSVFQGYEVSSGRGLLELIALSVVSSRICEETKRRGSRSLESGGAS